MTSCIHLWPNFYLTLKCTHPPGLLWRQPSKLRTITDPLCVSLVDAPWGPMSLKAFITCSNILLGINHPKTQVFHNLLSQSHYFLLCSQFLTDIAFWSYLGFCFFPLTLKVIPGKEKCDFSFGKPYMKEGFHPIKKAVSIHISSFITDEMEFTAKTHCYGFFKFSF